MGWSLWLKDPKTGERLETEEKHFMFGPNVCLGGTNRLELDITYNYGRMYGIVGFNPRDIYGKTGKEAVPILHRAIETLLDLDNDEETEEILKEDKERLAGIKKDYEEGKLSKESFDMLYTARTPDSYWFPSPRNSIAALENLVRLSEMALEGVWEGD